MSLFSSLDDLRRYLQDPNNSEIEFSYDGFSGRIRLCPTGRAAGKYYIDDPDHGPEPITDPARLKPIVEREDVAINGVE